MGLPEIRQKIDSIDEQIIKLLNERYQQVLEVGKWKQQTSSAVYVPEREKAVFERLERLNKGPMSQTTLRAVYREIMSGALSLEYPLRVAYLGPEATFTHFAAIQKFGHSVGYMPFSNMQEIFLAVKDGTADYGCVPVENSTEGVVNHTLDMFLEQPDIMVCAEVNLRIHHCLLSRSPLSRITRVRAHSQTLSQCRCWLEEHMRGVEIQETVSNTRAAELAAGEENAAAIAPALAADVYGLSMIVPDIEDNPNNVTRFLIISRKKDFSKPSGNDKTSICFSIRDRVGALYDCLLPFKKAGITLTLIESRPTKEKNWEYRFFIDLLGHYDDPTVREALEDLKQRCGFIRILGSYPCAIQKEDQKK